MMVDLNEMHTVAAKMREIPRYPLVPAGVDILLDDGAREIARLRAALKDIFADSARHRVLAICREALNEPRGVPLPGPVAMGHPD